MTQSHEKQTVAQRATEIANNIFEGDTSSVEYQIFLQLLIRNLVEADR